MSTTDDLGLSRGRRTVLRELRVSDLGWLWSAANEGATLRHWRFRGVVPPPEQFASLVWPGADLHLVVEALRDGAPLGLVQMISLDLLNGHGELAVLVPERWQRSAWPFEGVLLAIEWVFDRFAIRKLYVRTTSSGFSRYASAANRFLELEATFPRREYAEGRFEDVLVFSVSRSKLDFDLVARVLGRVPRETPRSWDGGVGRIFSVARAQQDASARTATRESRVTDADESAAT